LTSSSYPAMVVLVSVGGPMAVLLTGFSEAVVSPY
jgi:hypothetical protein